METIIQKALKILLDKFGADYDVVTVSEENGHYRANIETTDPARIIGKNGATINALEMFLKMILHEQNGEKIFFTLDVDGYKKSREDAVLDKVKAKIEWMKEQNIGELRLWPMRAGTRRMVHLWIAKEYPELTTDSDGDGRNRAIKVMYK